MSTTAPFGTWPSPITPGTITTRTVLLSQVRVDGGDTYWVEQRASQAGRNVLLRRDGDGQIGEVLPLTPADELVDVRTGCTSTEDGPTPLTAGSSWSRTLGTGACTATTWRTACAAWSP